MDVLANIRPDPYILKEPRGILKILQLVLAIFAFATITSMKTASEIFIKCSNETAETVVKVHYGYPFRIKSTAMISLPFCSNKQTERDDIFAGNFSASAEFFCFVGVISFLVCLLAVPAYVLFNSFFVKGTLMSKFDFVGSAVWTIVWFIASTAWADNVSKLIAYMDPDNLIAELGPEFCPEGRCRARRAGDTSNLVVSALFGFLNMGAEAAALWFLFKETDWFKDKDERDMGDPQADFDQPYADPGYQTPEYNSNPSQPTTPTGGMQSSFGSTGQQDYYGNSQTAY